MSNGPKKRLDQFLVDQGLAPSRSRAQDLIKSGHVQVNGEVVRKSGHKTDSAAHVTLDDASHTWVSRGALKLVKAIDEFGLNVQDKVAVDIGASTGGFTEVLLENGARRVYSVDVGHDQLAMKLREDPRVINCEGVNARYISSEELPEQFDIIVCDASFISLTLVLDRVMDLTLSGAQLVALIKPQFEVGKGRVGKGGIVRDTALHEEVCQNISQWVNAKSGWTVTGVCESPITGPDGNIEFLLFAQKA